MLEDRESEPPESTESNEYDSQRDNIRDSMEGYPVLRPDHPLLEQFQSALKEQLLLVAQSLKQEIFENELGLKKQEQKRESLGVQAYDVQQLIQRQKMNVEDTTEKLKTAEAARNALDLELEEKLLFQKKIKDSMLEKERQELELRGEVENMNLLINQMSKWESEMESNILINKRTSEKTRKDRLKLAEEKRLQDAVIYKILTHVWQLEREVLAIDSKIKVKESEREEMAQSVAVGNTNIEMIAAEHRALIHSWNSVIVAISTRDKVLNCLKDKISTASNEYKSILLEILQVKKFLQKEMNENEKHTDFKNRIERGIKYTKNLCNEEIVKKIRTEKIIAETQYIIEQIEKDIQKVSSENNQLKTCINIELKERDKKCIHKTSVEEKILEKISSSVLANNVTASVMKVLQELKSQNRAGDITLAELENKNATFNMEISNLKVENENCNSLLAECVARKQEVEEEYVSIIEEMKKSDITEKQKLRQLDIATSKYSKVANIFDGKTETVTDKLQTKINTLEKNINDLQESNKELQRYWLREQRSLVSLTQQRQQQIQDVNLLKKQIQILEQKNLKMNDEVAMHKKIEEKMMRNVHEKQSRLVVLSNILCQKRGMKQEMNKSNEVKEIEYITRLKDSELDCLKIESQITELEEDKITLSKELLELNREALEWEKKLIMLKETKDNLRKQEGTGADQMKIEIHRMQVRYGQLKRAQEKLVHDLNHAVFRRESILISSDAKMQKSKGSTDKTRFMFNRRLFDMENQIKQAQNQIDKVKEMIKDLENEIAIAVTQKAERESVTVNLQKEVNKIESLIGENETQRMLNFDLLVLKQKKLNIYLELSKGRTPYAIYRTESAITNEYSKQKNTNTKLCLLMANLIGDFPNHKLELNKLLNNLKVPAFMMYT